MTNRKDNPKNIKYVFRPSADIIEALELYTTSTNTSRTKAIEDLIRNGILLWLKAEYDK